MRDFPIVSLWLKVSANYCSLSRAQLLLNIRRKSKCKVGQSRTIRPEWVLSARCLILPERFRVAVPPMVAAHDLSAALQGQHPFRKANVVVGPPAKVVCGPSQHRHEQAHLVIRQGCDSIHVEVVQGIGVLLWCLVLQKPQILPTHGAMGLSVSWTIGPKSVGHVARFVLDHAPCPVFLARPVTRELFPIK